MKVTQEYLDNTKAIEKFLKTFNFEEKSAERIRQYIANPLSVVNDDIKALFAKYDNDVVDYRLPLPASMIKQRKKIQREIYLIYSLIFFSAAIMPLLSFQDLFFNITLSRIDISLNLSVQCG